MSKKKKRNKFLYPALGILLSALFIFSLKYFKAPLDKNECFVIFPGGYKIRAEKAVAEEEKDIGLMFRTELKDGKGMLFVYDDDGIRHFWMKNTLIDLDIIFIGGDLKINKIFKNVPKSNFETPFDKIARVKAKAKYVLEIKAGCSEKHGIREGMKLKILSGT